MPRPPDRLESLILPFAVLPQYEGEQDVVGTLTDMYTDEVVSAVLKWVLNSFVVRPVPSIYPSVLLRQKTASGSTSIRCSLVLS
jgi:hypothetical protein